MDFFELLNIFLGIKYTTLNIVLQFFWLEIHFRLYMVNVCIYTSLLLEGHAQITASSAVHLYKGLLEGWTALIIEVIHHWHNNI